MYDMVTFWLPGKKSKVYYLKKHIVLVVNTNLAFRFLEIVIHKSSFQIEYMYLFRYLSST